MITFNAEPCFVSCVIFEGTARQASLNKCARESIEDEWM